MKPSKQTSRQEEETRQAAAAFPYTRSQSSLGGDRPTAGPLPSAAWPLDFAATQCNDEKEGKHTRASSFILSSRRLSAQVGS